MKLNLSFILNRGHTKAIQTKIYIYLVIADVDLQHQI
jgi:hypothetical protein